MDCTDVAGISRFQDGGGSGRDDGYRDRDRCWGYLKYPKMVCVRGLACPVLAATHPKSNTDVPTGDISSRAGRFSQQKKYYSVCFLRFCRLLSGVEGQLNNNTFSDFLLFQKRSLEQSDRFIGCQVYR